MSDGIYEFIEETTAVVNVSIYYATILNDLLEIEPTSPEVISPPYRNDDTLQQKVQKLETKLYQFTKNRKRHHALTMAYYLGQLVEESSRDERRMIRSLATHYYRVLSSRVYRLFQNKMEQIYRTKYTTVRDIYKLRENELLELCELE